MRSRRAVESLDELERDLAVTPDESERLWLLRSYNAMNAEEYLAFLVACTRDLPPSREPSPEPEELFEL